MKQRSREINIFSISALDLFASALGAFILMSLVFMVFFTMTAKMPTADPTPPQCPEVEAQMPVECPPVETPEPTPSPATLAALEQAEANLAACEGDLARSQSQLGELAAHCDAVEQQIGQLRQALMEARIPPLDIVICLDVTGSMQDQIHGLKQEIDDLARVLDRLAPSVGIGVVAYGDRRWSQVIEKHAIVRTDAMTSLRRFVQALEPKGTGPWGAYPNPDLAEAMDRGIAKAIAMNWRPESERRYIIVVADAPPYPEEAPYALTRTAQFAAAEGHYLSAVMVARRDAEAFFRQLASAGRGHFVDDVGGQSMIASVLLAILDV